MLKTALVRAIIRSVTDLRTKQLRVYDDGDDGDGRIAELDWAAARLTGAVMLRTGSPRALLNATATGAGIALLPVIVAPPAGLIGVPASMVLPAGPVWMLTRRDARRLPAMRAVDRWITGTFTHWPADDHAVAVARPLR